MLPEEFLDLSKLRLNIAKERITFAEVRQGSDYDDFYLISKSEVEDQLIQAEKFVNEVEHYLSGIYQSNQ